MRDPAEAGLWLAFVYDRFDRCATAALISALETRITDVEGLIRVAVAREASGVGTG